MKNIIDICKDFGFEVPVDKQKDFLKAVAEEYKTTAEHGKALEKLDAMKTRAETAEDALKSFEGIDPADVKKQLEEANQKVKDAQDAAQKQLDERDFNDALRAELDSMKFTSGAARKAVETDIRAAGLKLRNGKIVGLSDMIAQIKAEDASAFVDEHQENLEKGKARFTKPSGNGGNPGGAITKKDIMSEKDPVKRQKLIGEHSHLFTKGE